MKNNLYLPLHARIEGTNLVDVIVPSLHLSMNLDVNGKTPPGQDLM